MGTAQVELDEQVPYQGDTLLTNPNQFRVTSAGDGPHGLRLARNDGHDP